MSGQSHGYEAQLHFSIRNPLTGGWLPPETIPTTVQQLFGPSEEIPGITVAPNGQVFVAWEEFVGNNYNIRVYRRDLSGNWALDEAFDQLSADEINPSLAAAPNGEIYLAWQNEGDGTIQVRRRDSAGVWNSEPTIPQQSGQAARRPALASDSLAQIYLAYRQGSVLKVTRRDTSGSWNLDPNLGDPSSTTSSAAMAVAVDSTDRLYVAWQSSNSGYSLERRNADGAWETIDEGIIYNGLDVTTDSLNQPHVISDDPSDTGPDDLQLYVDGEGILPRPRETILAPGYPALGLNEAGHLTAIWQAHPTDYNEDPARLYISVNQPQVTKHYYLNPGQRIATRVAGQVYYIHSDHLGSTTLLTDETGNEVSRVHYSPYGAIIEQSGALPTDRLYTGQRFEASLDLYDYRARFYDPYLNQFISPDPIIPDLANPQSWNRYAYVFNNPVKYTDPSGHQGCENEPGIRCYLIDIIEEPIRAAYKAPYTHPLPRKLIDQYVNRAGDLKLTATEMAETGTIVNLANSETFRQELMALGATGGGTKHIRFSDRGFANTHGTLGEFTINYEGDLTVNQDGTWVFDGTMNFYDYWDFDPQPYFNNPNARSFYGEALVRITYYTLPGQPFAITSEDVAVMQGTSSKEEAVWVGTHSPGVPSRLAVEISKPIIQYRQERQRLLR